MQLEFKNCSFTQFVNDTLLQCSDNKLSCCWDGRFVPPKQSFWIHSIGYGMARMWPSFTDDTADAIYNFMTLTEPCKMVVKGPISVRIVKV